MVLWYYGRLRLCPPKPPWARMAEYIDHMINRFPTSAGMATTTPLQFITERLEIADTDLSSRAAAEGFDYALQCVAYSIRSGESESITDLESILEYMDATSEDFSDEQYRAGYEYGVGYVQNILKLARHIG